MRYTMKAHPTTYAGVRFRSRLEARWAAFFDLAGWSWEYEPADLAGWSPDFLVTFPCPMADHDTPHTHPLMVEVKPYTALEQFHDHVAWSMMEGDYPHGIAVLGLSPVVSAFGDYLPHADQCCVNETYSVPYFVPTWSTLWRTAGNTVQWRRPA